MRAIEQMRKIAEFEEEAEKTPLMLPPVDTLLRFAIRGWTDAHGIQCALGESVPGIKIWAPNFIAMLANPKWADTYRNYAMRGALLYGGDTELVGCIARAFYKPETSYRIIGELARRMEEAWD